MLGFLQNEKFEGILLVILLFSGITKGALQLYNSLPLQQIHLVRCLTYISHRYFAPGQSVVISSPATYRYLQDVEIAEIHWPVVVNVDGNISKPDKTDFIDRYGSYIIFLQDRNFKCFHVENLVLTLDQH